MKISWEVIKTENDPQLKMEDTENILFETQIVS